jgi:hypothetical protein
VLLRVVSQTPWRVSENYAADRVSNQTHLLIFA